MCYHQLMNQANNIPLIVSNVILVVLIFVVNGLTLWRSAKSGQNKWFIAFFILTTLLMPSPFILIVAIAELLYLFKYSEEKLTLQQIKGFFRS